MASDTTTNIPNGENVASGAGKVQAADVGWQFVPQYYTFVHDAPHRLHCFYNKKSTFIHGVEGEEVKPCFGQSEIHQKILSLNFNDCKVYIHSIDSQSSYGGGIIIQVIGEMQNNSGPWRKFTQTFFLAEQPNGYFVLNDIFRYLKEEGEEDEDVDEEEEYAVEEEVAPTPAPAVQEPEPVVEEAPEVVEPEVPAIEEPEEVAPAAETTPALPVEETQPAPTLAQEEPITAAEPVVEEPTPAPTPATAPAPVEPAPTPAPVTAAVPSSTPSIEKPAPAPAPTPAPAPAPAQKPQPPAAPVQPPKPAGPKTWASLAAAGKGAWGAGAASSVQGVSAPAVAAAPAAAPVQAQQAKGPANGQQNGHHQGQQGGQRNGPGGKNAYYEAAQNVQTPICFVKLGNWQNPEGSDSVDEALLRAALIRFGEISKIEIVKGKACAFVDFKHLDSARKAITASLMGRDGGDGGIKLADGARVQVEARKEKEERPKQFGAGGGGQGGKRPPGQQQQQQQQGQGQQGGNQGQQGGEGFVQRQPRNKGRGGKGGPGAAAAAAGGEKPAPK